MTAPAGGAAVRLIVLANHSTLFSDADLMTTVQALRVQVQAACTAWGLTAPVIDVVQPTVPIPATGVALISVVDSDTDPGSSGVLGYHTTETDGEPDGLIFVQPILSNGGKPLTGELSVSVTISHEVLELVGNPGANRWRLDASGNLWAEEWADQTESDCYTINTAAGSVSVSNYLLPEAFDPGSAGPYDAMHLMTGPFQIRPGGYAVVNGQQQFGPPTQAAARDDQLNARTAAYNATKFHSGKRTARLIAGFAKVREALQS